MTVIKETSINQLSESQHQNYCEPIINHRTRKTGSRKKEFGITRKLMAEKGKRNSADKITVMAKKKKNVEVTKTPAVSCQNDLSGKLVEHFCSINEDDRRLA